jgi:hypothetical protein
MNSEPIAYVTGTFAGYCVITPLDPALALSTGLALYAAPPSLQSKSNRTPLTDEALRELFCATNTEEPLSGGWQCLERFARAIEKHHGITKEPELPPREAEASVSFAVKDNNIS